VAYVPDMWYDAAGAVIPSCAGLLTCLVTGATNNPGDGKLTFYWTNQESGRFAFYHDHAYGITRLNVYAGEAAGYLLSDPNQEFKLRTATVPGTIITPTVGAPDLAHLLPLVIQDKTFVPDTSTPGGQLAAQDPTWYVARYGGLGNLWFPHVYTPNQNPADVTGANAFGRWDYGPWFWPPQNPATLVSQPVPCTSAAYAANPPAFPPLMCPGTPNPSGTPESFMDTPIINGTAYPSLTVDPAAYRLQILSAGNDRTWNLGLYVADPLSVAVTNGGSGYMAAPAVTVTPPNGWVLASTVSSGVITSIQITAVGSGYTAAPNVTISGDGTGATATATIDVTTGTVTGIKVTNVGKGYTFAVVTIAPPAGCTTGCVTATAATTPTPSGSVLGVSIVTAGTAFTTAPVVTIAAPTLPGGTTATATTTLSPTAVRSITVSNRGAGYLLTKPPTVTIAAPPCTINGTTCILATATAQAVLGKVYISLGVAGAGYTSVPAVTIAAPPAGGTQATATATLLPTSVGSITVTNTGSGYTAAPAVTIAAPPCTINGTTCILATATAQAASGNVSISLGFAGAGYTSAPAVSIAAPSAGGTQASVTASINTEVKMVDAVPHSAASALKACAAPTATGGAGLAMASVVNGVPLNHTGLPANCYPSSWPTDGRDGGVPDPLSAGPPIIQIGTEGGLLPAPAVIPSTPVTYEYNRRSITVLNIFTHGLTMGPAERADVVVDFSKFAGKTLILYNDAPAPVPAFDSRVDYYTGDEDQTLEGGAPSTLPGYGPNTRTLMQIKVNATVTANNFNLATLQAAMPSIFATTQDPIIVPEPAYPAANGGAANPSYLRIQDNFLTSTWLPGGNPIALTLQNGGAGYTSAPAVTIAAPSLPGGITAAATTTLGSAAVGTINVTNSGAGYLSAPTVTIAVPSSCTINGLTCVQATAVAGPAIPLLPKTIQELFTLDYGRMNATLGVELPFTNFLTQTTIPYGYTDPPTEIFKDGETQLWKITHNGVDTHFIHFHLFTVQVINRVGWDGAIKPPDPNELSWKDTVRMNPLEDIIVALKPMKANLPFDLPNSIRPLDVTQPVGASLPNEFTNVDPANQGATVTNDLTNFGWEYVWHCHILGHEENDMMRPMILAVPPKVPGAPTASPATGTGVVNLTWSDNSLNETGFTIQRATLTGAFANVGTVAAGATTFNDTPPPGAYVYRVIANNLVGYTKAYVAPAVGYPTVSADSAPSAPSNSITR